MRTIDIPLGGTTVEPGEQSFEFVMDAMELTPKELMMYAPPGSVVVSLTVGEYLLVIERAAEDFLKLTTLDKTAFAPNGSQITLLMRFKHSGAFEAIVSGEGQFFPRVSA